MSEVRLVGVRKHYEGVARAALERLDLTFHSGELAVLVGPSGCGKSTTLRLVAGLEEASAGQIFIDDREVTQVPPARRDVAMVFQSYALYPHMSVGENLAFALRIRKLPDAEIRARVQAVARALDIDGYLDRRPKQLSGGQRQRVAIGRAMIREPKVFLFDEPLSNLDAKLRGEMRREIARVHAETRTTCLYVTHDQIEAMTLGDRIIVMRDGKVQQVGTPMEIYGQPTNRFVAGFFGTPAMNFLPATITRRGDDLAATGPGFTLDLPGPLAPEDEVTIGIRPEAVTLEERPRSTSLQAAVELREMLGAEVLLHLRADAGALTVRADAGSPAREGDRVTVWLDQDKLHWFDAVSEERL